MGKEAEVPEQPDLTPDACALPGSVCPSVGWENNLASPGVGGGLRKSVAGGWIM